MAARLDPADEYLHELGPEPTFNESMYFNVYDPSVGLGAFFRLGNRANEGHAEMTVCLYLPDGRVAFSFTRPSIAGNERFDAGGLRFDVVTPFEELRVRFDSKVVLLERPLEMADPKKAFTENPWTDARVDLTYRGEGADSMFGGERDRPEPQGEEFARGHYEQLVTAAGSVAVGEHEWPVAGFGLRDHSWGPRTWQAPWYYRWLTANFGRDFGFMASRVARQDGAGTRAGFVWDAGQLRFVNDVRITTEWDGHRYHRGLAATLTAGGDVWNVSGRVLNLIPLRNRRDGRVTRISEGLTEWTLSDGRVGYGLSEYLDQIVDGVPVGFAE